MEEIQTIFNSDSLEEMLEEVEVENEGDSNEDENK